MKDPLDHLTIDMDQLIQPDAKGQVVGYMRVSSEDQSTARQLEGIDMDICFTDKMTGSTKDRPELQRMIEYVRAGDTVIVHSLDRLARDLEDLLNIIKALNKKGVTFKSIKENLVFGGNGSNPMDKFLLHILGAVAEFNRSLIREAQQEGIRQAKQRGVYKGRKPVMNKARHDKLKELLALKNQSVDNYKYYTNKKIAEEIGISESTLKRVLKNAAYQQNA